MLYGIPEPKPVEPVLEPGEEDIVDDDFDDFDPYDDYYDYLPEPEELEEEYLYEE